MANTTNEPSPGPSPGSNTTDLKALFAGGINLETADMNTIETYIRYRFQQYADLNIEDWPLWDAIQVDFEGFKEEHFSHLNGRTWEILRGYCYKHGYWLDYKYGGHGGKSRATIMVKTLESDWYDAWTLDQIQWVEKIYGTLSRCTLIRKQELMSVTNPPSQQSGPGQSGQTGQPGLGQIGLGPSVAAGS